MQFLQIRKAEDQGLVEVYIRVEEEVRFLEDIVKHMTNDYVSEYAEKWNEERKKVAHYAAKNILFPHAVKWLKEKLALEASERLAEQCRVEMEQV